jgi:hypothetical protein
MAHTESITATNPHTLFQIRAKRFESLIEVHKKLLNTFEQVQRDRLARAMKETKLVSDFADKVISARSIPDIMAICQQWIAK